MRVFPSSYSVTMNGSCRSHGYMIKGCGRMLCFPSRERPPPTTGLYIFRQSFAPSLLVNVRILHAHVKPSWHHLGNVLFIISAVVSLQRYDARQILRGGIVFVHFTFAIICRQAMATSHLQQRSHLICWRSLLFSQRRHPSQRRHRH